jgi:chorismate-pyruvate lyase
MNQSKISKTETRENYQNLWIDPLSESERSDAVQAASKLRQRRSAFYHDAVVSYSRSILSQNNAP